MRLLVLAVLLSGCASDHGFNWAIQGQDGAIEGCPGQYHQYADQFLIGCWGNAN